MDMEYRVFVIKVMVRNLGILTDRKYQKGTIMDKKYRHKIMH